MNMNVETPAEPEAAMVGPATGCDRIGESDLLALCEIWRELDFSGPPPTCAEDAVAARALQ